MTPWLAGAGRAWFFAVAALAVTGAVARMPMLVLTAELLGAALAVAYLLAIRRGNALESDALEVRFEPRSEHGAWSRGEPVRCGLVVANHASVTLSRLAARLPELSGLAWDVDRVELGDLPPGVEREVTVTGRALRTGRWSLHGVELASEDALSLTRVSAWAACATTIAIRPRLAVARSRRARRERPRVRLPVGSSVAPRPGDGYDLRRIREHVPGDDVRRIAWKATARRGRLMVRQHEDEVVASTIVLVEASGSIRGGDGGAKLEYVADLLACAIADATARRDRLGVIAFDDDVLGALPALDGSAHYAHLTEHLLALGRPYAPGTTEAGDVEVTREVIEHLVLRERVDFRRSSKRTPQQEFAPLDERFHLDAFERWSRARFGSELDRARRTWRAAGYAPEEWSLARQLAAAIGVELTPRTGSWSTRRAASWSRAFAAVPSLTRQASTVVVVTDLEGGSDVRALRDAVLALRAARHRPVVLALDTASFVAPVAAPGDAVPGEVHRLFADAAKRERARAIEAVRGIGLPVVEAAASDAPSLRWEQALAAAVVQAAG